MDVNKEQAETIQYALDEWQKSGVLTPDEAARLRKTVSIKQNDRQQVAQYFFFIAFFCILMAFGVLFLNEKLLEKIKAYFSWSDLVIAFIALLLAASWFWYIGRKRNRLSVLAYEINMVLGGLATLTALLYFCKEFSADTYNVFLGTGIPVLVLLSALLRSKALWAAAIINIIAWYGFYSSAQETNNLFLGMNYPVRFTLLGCLLVILSFAQRKLRVISFTGRITYAAGLLLVLMGLWGISIFGNYGSLAEWHQVKQAHIFGYAVLSGIVAISCFYLGIRYKDETTRDLGVLFLLINLYTRYFEYFWDTMNKGIFFFILAVTFGLLGWWLEKKGRSLHGANNQLPENTRP